MSVGDDDLTQWARRIQRQDEASKKATEKQELPLPTAIQDDADAYCQAMNEWENGAWIAGNEREEERNSVIRLIESRGYSPTPEWLSVLRADNEKVLAAVRDWLWWFSEVTGNISNEEYRLAENPEWEFEGYFRVIAPDDVEPLQTPSYAQPLTWLLCLHCVNQNIEHGPLQLAFDTLDGGLKAGHRLADEKPWYDRALSILKLVAESAGSSSPAATHDMVRRVLALLESMGERGRLAPQFTVQKAYRDRFGGVANGMITEALDKAREAGKYDVPKRKRGINRKKRK